MSMRQFMWNLAGMESEIPEEELAEHDETVIQDIPSAEQQSNERPDTPIQEESEQPGMLSGIGSFIGLGGSPDAADRASQETPTIDSPATVDPTTPKQDEAPSSPFGVMGSWFGASPATPEPPALEPVAEPAPEAAIETTPSQAEGKADEEGIGGFFSSLWGGGQTEDAKPKEEEAPGPSYTANPPKKAAAVSFDNTDAADTVARIENGLDPTSKRLQRLLVANEAEAQLRMFETEAAMRKLRVIQSETNAIVQKSTGMGARTDGKLPPASATAKSDAKLPPASMTPEEIAANKLSSEALKKAREVLRSVKRTPITIKALTKGPQGHWRASHSLVPMGAPSSRLQSFPRSEVGAHSARPLSTRPAVPANATETRGSIVVASVESRSSTRSRHMIA